MKQSDISFILQTIWEGGETLKQLFGKVTYQHKSAQTTNLVTEADMSVENFLITKLKARFPNYTILSEETLSDVFIGQDPVFVIDPLDGTNNFAHGIPHFCISLGLWIDQIPFMGVVYEPNRNEMFYSVKREGAFCNRKQIQVSGHTDLKNAIIATGFNYERGPWITHTLSSIQSLFDQGVRGIRRMGSAAMDICYVASGRYEGYFEYVLKPWDFAGAIPVLIEAGGLCQNIDGSPLDLKSSGVLCANPVLARDFFPLVITSKK